jgi:DNA helicase-2/ATP-dependent DNA helicase PcrA
MAAAYLDALNPEQRQAEHAVESGRAEPAGPLLIIAGVGSGKTNTLAHRVAHLIVISIVTTSWTDKASKAPQ